MSTIERNHLLTHDIIASARDLEAIARQLWATEPRCALDERSHLLAELHSTRIALEWLILRATDATGAAATEDAHDERQVELRDCADRLQQLLVHWPHVAGRRHTAVSTTTDRPDGRSRDPPTCTTGLRTARPTRRGTE